MFVYVIGAAGAALPTERSMALDEHTASGRVRLLRGRFEAEFEDAASARAAARDGRAVGFVVDLQENSAGWLAIARRRLPFPGDERDRYASRFNVIVTQHGGAFSGFVEETA